MKYFKNLANSYNHWEHIAWLVYLELRNWNIRFHRGYERTNPSKAKQPWWRHQMETFSALLAIYAGNSPVTGEFPAQRLVTRSFDIFFDLRLNQRWVNNREAGDLRRYRAHYDVFVMYRDADLLGPSTNIDLVARPIRLCLPWQPPTNCNFLCWVCIWLCSFYECDLLKYIYIYIIY